MILNIIGLILIGCGLYWCYYNYHLKLYLEELAHLLKRQENELIERYKKYFKTIEGVNYYDKQCE